MDTSLCSWTTFFKIIISMVVMSTLIGLSIVSYSLAQQVQSLGSRLEKGKCWFSYPRRVVSWRIIIIIIIYLFIYLFNDVHNSVNKRLYRHARNYGEGKGRELSIPDQLCALWAYAIGRRFKGTPISCFWPLNVNDHDVVLHRYLRS